MVDQIEHLWSMPPNPSYGCLVDDRYLVVSDAGVDEGPYKGFFSIVDLQTGAHDMFVSTYQTPVHGIVAMNGYAWIWRQTVNIFDPFILQRITPSTGGVENIPTPLVRAGAPLVPDPSREFLYGFSSTGATAGTSRAFAFDTVSGEVVSLTANSVAWSGVRYFDPDLDKLGVIHQATLRLCNPEDLNEEPIEHAITGSLPPLTFVAAKTEYRDGLVAGSIGTARILFDTEELEASLYYGIPGKHGNLGDDGKWYTSTSSVAESFDTKLRSFNTTTLTSRGNRGTAIPVGNRLYIPAGSRPE